MARFADRLPLNADGEFYVDATCIDCDLCRQLAPMVFDRAGDQSVVRRQPADAIAERRALMALVTCPTSSIGTVGKHDLRAAVAALPEPITDEIYFCGFASRDSFGASSYLVCRPDGNLLVDSPRAARPLLANIAALGGVTTMLLTHRDDVADHAQFHRRFGCTRVLHRRDLSHDTASVERVLDGDAPISLGPGLLAIPVPGHTRGSIALLVDDTYLFTGDHLWWDDDDAGLQASQGVCWYSWPEQVRSVERLLDYRFEWVLPGHGRRYHAASSTVMRAEVEHLVRSLRR